MPQAVGRYKFTHALIQATLIGELSATRRVRLHARIGEALEELNGEDVLSNETCNLRVTDYGEPGKGKDRLLLNTAPLDN